MSVGVGEGGVEPIAHPKDSFSTFARRSGVSIGEGAVLVLTLSVAVLIAWAVAYTAALIMG